MVTVLAIGAYLTVSSFGWCSPVLIRFGSLQAVYASAFFINAVCVWLLWLHNAPDDAIPVPGARTSATAHRRKSTRFEPKLDFDGLLSDVPVKLSQSASSKLSNSNLQQPFVSKFAGTVNGTGTLISVDDHTSLTRGSPVLLY